MDTDLRARRRRTVFIYSPQRCVENAPYFLGVAASQKARLAKTYLNVFARAWRSSQVRSNLPPGGRGDCFVGLAASSQRHTLMSLREPGALPRLEAIATTCLLCLCESLALFPGSGQSPPRREGGLLRRKKRSSQRQTGGCVGDTPLLIILHNGGLRTYPTFFCSQHPALSEHQPHAALVHA
jgi:hypothetical protein